MLNLPGVFRPISDSWLLAECLREQTLPPRASVLDVCTGSGVLAVSAALRGARSVTAIDVSRRAMLSVKLNARVNGVKVRTLRGDLFAPVHGERFDAIVSNPPYVPAEEDELPARGLRRAWDAGHDGRILLDRICDEAPGMLNPGGFVLLTHTNLIGTDETCRRLQDGGLEVDVIARRRGPLGPLMSARVQLLEERGMLPRGTREEEVVVVRGRRPKTVTARTPASPGATVPA